MDKSCLLLEQINEIEIKLQNIEKYETIIYKYKYISSNFMKLIDNSDKHIEINPLIIYKIINNDQLLIDNYYFKVNIHNIYTDMMINYIKPDYSTLFKDEYISTEAKIYKIYIFRITTEKKLLSFENIDILNKNLEDLLKKYIMLIT